MALTSQDITMGSGNLYLYPMNMDQWNNYVPCVSPALSDIEQEQYRIGHIVGGATLTYEPTYFSIKDDMSLVGITGLQEENVSFKSGVLTWSPATLNQITTTGALTTDATNKTTTLMVGGMAQYNQPDCLLHFSHASGNQWLQMKSEVSGGYEIQYVKDNASAIDITFSGMPIPGQNGALWALTKKTE